MTDVVAGIEPRDVLLRLEHANLPSLVMVLYQLTGDERWMAPPFRPVRARGLDDNADGGFDAETATAIRTAAAEAISDWHRGVSPALAEPEPATFGAMLECFLAEPVPAEYWSMFAVEHGLAPDPAVVENLAHAARAQGFSVAIVGAGISGMLAAVTLDAAGVPFEIFERGADVGGVWLDNRYPGAGVDTPSNLYSYSRLRADWSTAFARRGEVIGYLRRFAQEARIADRTHFNASVQSCEWDPVEAQWTLTIDSAAGPVTHRANAVISAVGLFSEPFVPEIAGIEEFDGPVVHSSRWPDGLDVAGLRVAVVGSGASAMQIVPAVADVAESVVILQRTPQWIAPVRNYFDPVPGDVHWLLRHVPFYFNWCRTRSGWNFNDKNYPALIVDPEWPEADTSISRLNEYHRNYFLDYIDEKLGDRPDLKAKVVPTYPPYGKRILLDNGWYDALVKPSVRLECEGLARVAGRSIVTPSGRTFEVDAIVLCTGFQTTRYLSSLDVSERQGNRLHDVWGDDDAYAYLGITTPGFPNLFFMYGPGTNAGGGSFVTIAESQVRCIIQLIAELLRRGSRSIEPRADVTREYNQRMDEANGQMVWSHPGMTTYVRNASGRVTVNMPWRIVDYWSMTSAPELGDYVFDGSDDDPS